MTEYLVEGLSRALADSFAVDKVRRFELEGAGAPWALIEPLGYTEAFVGEALGGIGLSLNDACSLGEALGRHAFPLPLLDTAVARALLAPVFSDMPDGPIVLCDALPSDDGLVSLPETAGLMHATHALVAYQGQWHLMALGGTAIRPGLFRPRVSGSAEGIRLSEALAVFEAQASANTLMASLQAAEMAGAMQAIQAMTLTYINERSQFGRQIGRFQAVQMEASVLAEQVAFATMAARMGCRGTVAQPDILPALGARLASCDAARRVIAISHALHGAIGITEEYALGLYTRRLQEWCMVGASPEWCAREVGKALIGECAPALQFVREHLSAN